MAKEPYNLCYTDCEFLRERDGAFGCSKYCVRLPKSPFGEPYRFDDCKYEQPGFEEVQPCEC